MADILDILVTKMVVTGADTIATMSAMLFKSCLDLDNIAESPMTGFIAASILILRYVEDMENSNNFTMFWSHHMKFSIAQHRKFAAVLLDFEIDIWRHVDFTMPVLDKYEEMEIADHI
jgi:hypothetical protein